MRRKVEPDMLEELDVRGVINAVGTVTTLGGSTPSKVVMDAMTEASKVYLDMTELHTKAGDYVARLLGAPAAYITCGAAAGLVLSISACMTRSDIDKISRLPKTDGMPNEAVVQSLQRNMYDRNLELAGAKVVEVGNQGGTRPEELEESINRNTAAVVYFNFDPQEGVLPLERVITIAHKRDIPVITDAAAEVPPVENFGKFLKMGSDIVIFSGGKDVGGPNNTGLILGRKDLVDVCMSLGPQSYQVHDPRASPYRRTRVFSGRPMKTSKESIVGLVAALKEYVNTDHKKRIERFEARLDSMASALSGLSKLRVRKIWPGYGHARPLTIPRLELTPTSDSLSAEGMAEGLRQGQPPIHVWMVEESLFLNPQCVMEEDDEVIVARIRSLASS
jgi:uncharacterized pyridoxal phosphate-dependent enzyme